MRTDILLDFRQTCSHEIVRWVLVPLALDKATEGARFLFDRLEYRAVASRTYPAGRVSRSPVPLPDFFGKNLVDVPAMPDIMNFYAAGDVVDTVNHPIALGSKRQIAG